MNTNHKSWLISFSVMVLLTVCVSFAWFHKLMPLEMASAWVIVMANALVAAWVNRKAVGRDSKAFLMWALGGNLARFLALVALTGGVYVTHVLEFMPFFAALLTGYFAFMLREVTGLVSKGGEKEAGNE